MTGVYVAAGLILALIAFWLLAFRKGRQVERADAIEEAVDVKDEQLEIAANAPRTASGVAEAIRKKGGF